MRVSQGMFMRTKGKRNEGERGERLLSFQGEKKEAKKSRLGMKNIHLLAVRQKEGILKVTVKKEDA